MKRILIIVLLACAISMSAQDNTGIPSYRNKGYSGSVSFTDQALILLGLDTSHGYMFDEHHFLGGGIGFYAAPIKGNPIGYHVHAEYKYYWFKRNSTPTASVKVGYGGAILTDKEYHSDAFMPYGNYKLEPNIGWDWGLKNGNGFSLSLGADILINEILTKDMYAIVLPKISLGITF